MASALAPGNQVVRYNRAGFGRSPLAEPARKRFKEVADDSRCPLQAECVWAGYGEIVLDVITEDGDLVEETLQTREGSRSLRIGGYELTMLDLSPYPEVPGGIDPGDYRVRLVVKLVE